MTRRQAGEARGAAPADRHRPRRRRRPRRHPGRRTTRRSSASTSRAGSPWSSRPRATRPSDSVDKAKEIIRQRIDGLGVAEPEVTRQGDTSWWSCPGVKDRKKAQQIVGQTAKLEFRPVLQSVPARATRTDRPDPEQGRTASCVNDDDDDHHHDDRLDHDDHRAGRRVVDHRDDARTTTTTAPTTTRRRRTARPPRPTTTAPAEADGADVLAHRARPTTRRRCACRSARSASRASSLSRAKAELDTDDRLVEGGGRHQGQREGHGQRAFNACYSGTPECPTKQAAIVLDGRVQSYPTVQGQNLADEPTFQITGDFSRVRGQGPRPGAALRRPAGRVRAQRRAAGLGHARRGLARRRPPRRPHRPRRRRPLHAPLLPGPRPGRDPRPAASGGAHVLGRSASSRRSSGPRALAGRRHRHHRVGRHHRRLLRRVLRAAEGRGPSRARRVRSVDRARLPAGLPHDPHRRRVVVHRRRVLWWLTVGPVRGLRLLPRPVGDPRRRRRLLLHPARWCRCSAAAGSSPRPGSSAWPAASARNQ